MTSALLDSSTFAHRRPATALRAAQAVLLQDICSLTNQERQVVRSLVDVMLVARMGQQDLNHLLDQTLRTQ